MIDGFQFFVGALATWRLSSMLVNEDGPFDVFLLLRGRAGVYYLGDDKRPDTFLGRLLSCLWCTSVWVAAGVFLFALTPLWWMLAPLALSAAAIILDELCK